MPTISITPETTETPNFRIVQVALYSSDEMPMYQIRDIATNDVVAVCHTRTEAYNQLCHAETRRSFGR